MALRVPAAMALCLLLSLMAVARCVVVPHEEAATDLATTKAAADGEGEGLLRLPSTEDSAVPDEVGTEGGEVPVEEEAAVQPVAVAEPDPDRSHPDSDDGAEELTAEKLSIEGQEDEENTEEQIHDDEDDEEEKDNDGDGEEEKKKRKKQRGGDGKGKKKEKKTKKHHQSNDAEEEEEEEKAKKQFHHHRRHRVEKVKTKKRPCHDKNRNSNGDDEHEKKAKRWRKKAISRSLFGHGRRSQREEAAKEEVNN